MIKNNALNRYIPYQIHETIYDIDYNSLYESGKRIIIFDVDNTISRYIEKDPSDKAVKLMEELKEIGFMIIVLSNNNGKRIRRAITKLNVIGFYKASKPLKKGYKQVLSFLKDKRITDDFSTAVSIGDQLMTDILGSNRMGIDAILVRPLHLKDEKWYTKINRVRERRIIKKLKKYDFDKYQQIIAIRKEEF